MAVGIFQGSHEDENHCGCLDVLSAYSRCRYRRSRRRSRGSPLGGYDRSAAQSSTMRKMVQLMRQKGFLTLEHRQSAKLRNVLGTTVRDLEAQRLQTMVLDIENHGRNSAELHAAALFPELFGPPSKEDFEKFFNWKSFCRVWTKQLQIPTAGPVMEWKEEAQTSHRLGSKPKRTLTDLHLLRTKPMTTLTLAEDAAVRAGDVRGADQASNCWEELHASRFYLISGVGVSRYKSRDSTRNGKCFLASSKAHIGR